MIKIRRNVFAQSSGSSGPSGGGFGGGGGSVGGGSAYTVLSNCSIICPGSTGFNNNRCLRDVNGTPCTPQQIMAGSCRGWNPWNSPQGVRGRLSPDKCWFMYMTGTAGSSGPGGYYSIKFTGLSGCNCRSCCTSPSGPYR